MTGDARIGDYLTITFDALDQGRLVTVRAKVVTVDDVFRAVADAMRGAGFQIGEIGEVEDE